MTGPRVRAPDAALLLPLDPASPVALHRQVYDGLRQAILAGRLPAGARLPSTRVLAEDLGVSRNTVTAAFEQLRAEGYVVGRRGGGTRVRGALPDALLRPRPVRVGRARDPRRGGRPASAASAPAADPEPPGEARGLSGRGRALADEGAGFARRAGTAPIAFRLGIPAIEPFPGRTWAKLTARRWRRGRVHLGESDPAGDPELRRAIAGYLVQARGARCTAEQVMVVSGTQQALNLIARLLLEPGDVVWMEDPGYFAARTALAAAEVRVVPVPVDEEGIDVGAGASIAPDARMVYVTPSHQFPLGAVMSAPRRLALLSWARRTGAWVVEDDYDSEFRYAGRPLPCLQGLEAAGDARRVLYLGTFSKTLVPGLRLAYAVVPDPLVDAFRAGRGAIDRYPATFDQGALADFIEEGHYARHVRRVRTLYAERQGILLEEARRELAGLLTVEPDAAGLHLVGWLPPGVDDVAATAAAAAHGVEVSPLSRYRMMPAAGPGALLLGYAACDESSIRAGVARLRDALSAGPHPKL